jgi:hypothetical protein
MELRMLLTMYRRFAMILTKMIAKGKTMFSTSKTKNVYSDEELTVFTKPMSYKDMINELKK